MSASPASSDQPDRARVRKRLVVCCDGTWQSSVTLKKNVPSNITRLARSFAREDVTPDGTVWEQVVYYDAGIGTGDISSSETRRQGGFGSGFTSNVIEAYNFLTLNWYPGDKVYCFGFSRGAYTARAVAGLVNDIGIISPRDMQDFPQLYSEYLKFSKGDSHMFRRSRQYRKWQTGIPSIKGKDKKSGLQLWDRIPHKLVTEDSRLVEVVGVFDTVGILGVPKSPYLPVDALMATINAYYGGESQGFHNVNLSPYIRNAFHAMALDEHRGPFSPTLWHLPPDKPTTAGAAQPDHKTILEAFQALHFNKPAFAPSDPKNKEEVYKKQLEEEAYEKRRLDYSNLSQVWFPGVHINVGGGSKDPLETRQGDYEQIALITFAWMCEQVKPFIRFEDKLRKRSVRDRMALVVPVLAELAAGGNRDFGKLSWARPFWRALDSVGIVAAKKKEIPNTTLCGWAEGPIIDSYAGAVKLTGSITRTPGEYRTDAAQPGVLLGKTNEAIHPCVAYRKKIVPGYEPEALKGFERKYVDGRWLWAKKSADGTVVEVAEFSIPATAKFSRFLAADYVHYLAKLEQEEEDHKSVKSKRETSEPSEPKARATNATAFLESTDQGKEWFKPKI
ncbi:hypothetical protein Micbo1qcDRAFT_221916 [Microdochium bolleyi]|uniref:T6SS Phospholipase effector Tle1-like catalytic domain-containing protein n=1 Tax=Microdochium bolleyi TaxID=196109 RepID=A0A136IKX0_9PEZI|nr:hypothetical protein Micbo1qcDRAFT_221916 [Microdochium bolleyi]